MSGRAVVLAGLALLSPGRSPSTAGIAWLHDEGEAFAESRRTGRPVLVDAWAEWCAACKLLDRHTWSDARVQRAVSLGFVPLRIDLSDEGPGTDARMKAYGVEGLPTVLSCPAPGCTTSARRAVGYLKPEEMLDFLAPR